MSATLSLMLKLIDPKTSVLILEKLDKVAQESTQAWNNSGTGHSAFCEFNYTPEKADGSTDISKAINIFEQYERTKQFWTFLLEEKPLTDPQSFIHSVPADFFSAKIMYDSAASLCKVNKHCKLLLLNR